MTVEALNGLRPPYSPEKPSKTDDEFFEDLLKLRAKYRLRQQYTDLPPEDRISPPTEPHAVVFPSSGSISFVQDFEHLAILHSRFGIREGQRLSHDPVIDRGRYERAQTEEEGQTVKEGVIADMEKNLYERARTQESTVIYYQDEEGKIFNPKFPNEPFDVVLQRGLEYSKKQSFVDYAREAAEFEGWKKVMRVLFDEQTPLQSKAIVISGPGLKRGTAFTDNFVDIFAKTLDPDTGKIAVVMTRFASEISYKEYKKIAVGLDRQYFNQKDPPDEEIDIYFKENPVFTDLQACNQEAGELFSLKFKKQTGATEEEKTKEYLGSCKLFILHYVDTVCSKFFDPEKVKTAFNAVLNKFDSLRSGLIKGVTGAVNKVLQIGKNSLNYVSVELKNIQAEINYYGRLSVKAMMRGCGLSAGFSVGGGSLARSVIRSLSGIISAVGGGILGSSESDQYGSLEFECPKCKQTNRRPRGELISNCHYCQVDVRC